MIKSGRHNRGQALVEFALILPLLLLIIFGIIDFSRAFFVYVNLTNAAREGTRYGLVNPRDYTGIDTHARSTVDLVPAPLVTVNVWYDKGPGTATFSNPQYVTVGDRVVVEIAYDLEPVTPLIQPFAPVFPLHTVNARTIQTLGTVVSDNPNPAPPNEPPGDGATPTSTPGGGPTATATPVAPTATATPRPPTATPTPVPLRIVRPLLPGSTQVGGIGQPGQMVTLRIVQTGFQQSVFVNSNGQFLFTGIPPLVAGYTVIVQGYGQQDLVVVETGTATPTATPTPLPSPTPTPSGVFIAVTPGCAPVGATQTFQVTGSNWPTGSAQKRIAIYWDTVDSSPEARISAAVSFNTSIQVNVTAGTHTIIARTEDNQGNYTGGAQVTFQVTAPCPATPTPRPQARPNLIINGMLLRDTPPLGTYQKLHLEVGISNQGALDAASLFWVDLFADTPADPLAFSSVDYVAVDGLLAGSTLSFTMYVPDGFAATGVHTLTAMVDTWDQIAETSELDNLSRVYTVTIASANPTPTPTPTPEVTPGAGGAIEGTTYMYTDGLRPQSVVSVYVYDAQGRLYGSTRSDNNGAYHIGDLPPNSTGYTVRAVLRIGDQLYVDQAVAPVYAGMTTTGVDFTFVPAN